MAGRSKQVFVGVDSGTQSTKVLLIDGESGEVLGVGSTAHELIGNLPPGHLEQHPADWFSALESALREAATAGKVDPHDICAVGVSGQQHGLVALDAEGEVIRPAKLWCDTCTAPQCEELLARVGGIERYIQLTGNGLPPGFTASKILWLKQNEPDKFARLHTVLLPHDYLNYRLTGMRKMECGDASGTALLDVRRRTWCREALVAIDEALADRLPSLSLADEPCGTIRAEVASRLGLRPKVLVSAGGGDNMMSAIGTGNVVEGIITVSLGTSGTVFAYSSKPIVDPGGEIAAFCDSTGAWLPLVCTMNVTVATELTKLLFHLQTEQLDGLVASVPTGADGLVLVPYFEGERTPNIPAGTGVWFGANRTTHTPAHFCRAAMEGATLGLNYGLRRLAELGLSGREVRLTGGGANSAAWRRIAADVFNLPVVCLRQSESAALGAAMQARWCWERACGSNVTIHQIAEAWVERMEDTRVEPDARATEIYQQLGQLHDQVSSALHEGFNLHRKLVTNLLR